MKDEIVLVSNLAHPLKGVGIKLSQLQKEMQLNSTKVIKSYLLHAPVMAFLSIYAVGKELQNKECTVIDVKGLTIGRNFYFARLQGEAQALPELFMRFALHSAARPDKRRAGPASGAGPSR